ncbi:MAG: type II toxin-antitoxin system RelE/ParE family toxin [Hyphomicrobiales bacterium]|nr:type II toxin-antitoxin system RelE/ParE family toxin [Hyphomicrobiales bacterium]
MRLRYRAEAASDLDAIYDYVASDSEVAAVKVLARIRDAIEPLLIFPLSGRIGTVPGTRELIVPSLPYIVVYQVLDDRIDILGVVHAARDR